MDKGPEWFYRGLMLGLPTLLATMLMLIFTSVFDQTADLKKDIGDLKKEVDLLKGIDRARQSLCRWNIEKEITNPEFRLVLRSRKTEWKELRPLKLMPLATGRSINIF